MTSNPYEFVGNSRSFSGLVRESRTDQIWQNTSFHRNQVFKVLNASTKVEKPTLCVWGAGECNDLDLIRIVRRFSEITLADIDAESLAKGLELQNESSEKIELVGGLDISGVHELVKKYGELDADASDSERSELVSQIQKVAGDHRLEALSEYDVVVSVCMLSQLQNHLTENFDVEDPAFGDLLKLTRQRHLEMLLEHTKPGGSAILVTDFTSSDSLPSLANASSEMVTDGQMKAIVEGNHFHGLNPLSIQADLENHNSISSQIAKCVRTKPWIWNATNRHYACVGICIFKVEK